MTTFTDVYVAGNGYAPVRVLIKNETNEELFYNFKGVNDAFGNKMEEYGYQTTLYSTYQAVMAGADPNADLRNATLSMITDNPFTGFLKASYYLGKVIYKGVKEQKVKDAMKQDAYVTNYRSGFVKKNVSLYIELGSIPVDGTLNNKGWATTADIRESFIGPCGQKPSLWPPGTYTEDMQIKNALKNGVGIRFWGDTKSFWDKLTGNFFNFNMNLENIPGSKELSVIEDSRSANQATSSPFVYRIDGGGIDPRTDFINITINQE